MKTAIRATALPLTLALVLTGCIDIEQHVTAGSSGGVRTFIRFTFDKALFELAGQMGGEPVDYDQMLSEADLEQDDLLEVMPAGVEAIYQPVNTAARFGFDAEISVPGRLANAPFRSTAAIPSNSPDLDRTFFPYRLNGGLVIPIEGIGESDEQSEAFLASAEYSLTIGSSLMPTVSAVHVVSPGEAPSAANRSSVEPRDYRDYTLVAVPLTELQGDGPQLVVVLP